MHTNTTHCVGYFHNCCGFSCEGCDGGILMKVRVGGNGE